MSCPPDRRSILAVAAVAGLVPLLFALYTGQGWEDFFISLRHSVHLVEGHGLTYQTGERIQGFTSPLAVLLGAGAYAVSGAESAWSALWVLRVLGIAAFSTSLYCLMRSLSATHSDHGDRPGHVPGHEPVKSCLPWVIVVVLYAFESKSVAFAVNGMETPFFVMFLAGAIWSLAEPRARRGLWLGLCWAGMMWTRPDGSFYILLMGIGTLLFPDRSRKAHLREALVAGGVCTAVYLPWFLFSWTYYGSPVPQTIIALRESLGPWHTQLKALLSYNTWVPMIYLPPYADEGGWGWTLPIGYALGAVGVLFWIVPGRDRLARRTSFMAFGITAYLASIGGGAPWYFPPVFLLTLPSLFSATAVLSDAVRRNTARRRFPGGQRFLAPAATVTLSLYALIVINYALVARAWTEVNEKNNRIPIGLWLKENARPDDTVFLECPGFIGLYSGLKMLDYPGLVSPEVTRSVEAGNRTMSSVARALSPDWLVLRPFEFHDLEGLLGPELWRKYEVVKVFDQASAMAARLPRYPQARFDSVFMVLRRVPG